ncbi:hypothetical protein GCM10009844_41700 [Nocardioides koreensis]|uniref:Protein kinase domain-containing protein n=1 Tax=Nocardioides koreensis TaxID=433651 RepID=A0ABP5M131_9ACTN
MSGAQPRAVGVRAPYAALPDAVRAWVDDTLGSPVVAVAEQVGGMSPGCATRVTCADGTRAFVKAVGTELNPDTPNLFRREATVLGLLGSHPLWAELLASYDDGAWVALLLEDVEGTHPDLDDDREMARLLEATDELAAVTRSRVPDPPVPDPGSGGLNDLRDFSRWSNAFDHLDEVPAHLLPGWVRERAGSLQAGVDALSAMPGAQLVHWDIRQDNLLVRPGGELVFVDWGQAGVGADWLDPLLARLERVHLPWFDDALAASPALVRAGDGAVTSWLVGFGTFLAWRAVTAVDVNLPTLGDFRRRESARALGAAARRLDLGGHAARC